MPPRANRLRFARGHRTRSSRIPRNIMGVFCHIDSSNHLHLAVTSSAPGSLQRLAPPTGWQARPVNSFHSPNPTGMVAGMEAQDLPCLDSCVVTGMVGWAGTRNGGCHSIFPWAKAAGRCGGYHRRPACPLRARNRAACFLVRLALECQDCPLDVRHIEDFIGIARPNVHGLERHLEYLFESEQHQLDVRNV